jgi:hypothetical protein
VLPVFEARYPQDQRPRQAIEAALAWAMDPSPENAAAAYAAADAARLQSLSKSADIVRAALPAPSEVAR